MPTLDQYKSAIVSLHNGTSNIDSKSHDIQLRLQAHMFSNTKIPAPRLLINSELVPVCNKYTITYNCLHCHVAKTIRLILFLRKVKNNVIYCNDCKNSDPDKRREHVAFMTGKRLPPTRVAKWTKKSVNDKVSESIKMFNSEDTVFKMSYYNTHLSDEEFETIRTRIISVGKDLLTDLSGWNYVSAFRVYNQTKYTPMLVNLSLNKIQKPHYIKWSCDQCKQEFVNRDLETQKNKKRLLCGECGFSNRIFKIKSKETPWGAIRYQSKYELNFIEWCIEKNIRVLTGPDIRYLWKKKSKTYKVDFQLPDHKRLIELKDNHIWHKRQVESGLWLAKETCAKDWCTTVGWKYEIIFPSALSEWKELLIVV